MVAGQGMTNQDCIVPGRIQVSIGFIAQPQLRNAAPRFKFKAGAGNKILSLDDTDFPLSRDRDSLFGIVHTQSTTVKCKHIARLL